MWSDVNICYRSHGKSPLIKESYKNSCKVGGDNRVAVTADKCRLTESTTNKIKNRDTASCSRTEKIDISIIFSYNMYLIYIISRWKLEIIYEKYNILIQ